jgi:phosphoribosylanthranilate isomerase
MTRIKICGITRTEDALVCAHQGADAIGLNFYPGSARCVALEQAAEIVEALPPFVTPVALFVNSTSSEVERVLDRLAVDLLQFHGDEDEVFCSQFGMPYLKAIRVGEGTDLVQCALAFHSAKALLLDALVAGSFGGTGRVFDWQRIPDKLNKPILLSGGLTAQNVGRAVREARPWAVDVSSGVEASRGVKDAGKIIEFIRSVRREDAGQPA